MVSMIPTNGRQGDCFCEPNDGLDSVVLRKRCPSGVLTCFDQENDDRSRNVKGEACEVGRSASPLPFRPLTVPGLFVI